MFITSSCVKYISKCLNAPEKEPESVKTFNKPQKITFAIDLILATGAITATVLAFLAMSNVNLGALNALSQIGPNGLQGMFYAGAGIIAVNTFVGIITTCKRASTLQKRALELKQSQKGLQEASDKVPNLQTRVQQLENEAVTTREEHNQAVEALNKENHEVKAENGRLLSREFSLKRFDRI